MMDNFIGIIRLIYNTFCSGHFQEWEEFVAWDVFEQFWVPQKKSRTVSSVLLEIKTLRLESDLCRKISVEKN